MYAPVIDLRSVLGLDGHILDQLYPMALLCIPVLLIVVAQGVQEQGDQWLFGVVRRLLQKLEETVGQLVAGFTSGGRLFSMDFVAHVLRLRPSPSAERRRALQNCRSQFQFCDFIAHCIFSNLETWTDIRDSK